MGKVIRVLLVDDHPPLRVGLRVLLNRAPDVEVVAEAGSGQDALALIESHQPDVVVLDCQLPDMDGVGAATEVQQRGLPVKVLALSAYADDPYVQGMMAAGAVGYLLKEEAPGAIVDAVRAAARGEERFSPTVAARMAAWAREETLAPPIADLTGREREVLQWLVKGWNNQRIAKELGISERTVRFHLRNAYDKIDVNSRTEAAVWAVRQGLEGQDKAG